LDVDQYISRAKSDSIDLSDELEEVMENERMNVVRETFKTVRTVHRIKIIGDAM
jgi:hypothetical protein